MEYIRVILTCWWVLSLLGCGNEQPGLEEGSTDIPDYDEMENEQEETNSVFCLDNLDCPGDLVCNPFSHRCVPYTREESEQECILNDDCVDGEVCHYGICIRGSSVTPSLGEECTLSCEEDLICISTRRGEATTCHLVCQDMSDCSANEHCVPLLGYEAGVCVSDCDIYLNDCPEEMTCLPITGGGYDCMEAGIAPVGSSCEPSKPDACAPGLICEAGARNCADICDPVGSRKQCPGSKNCTSDG